MSIAQPYPCLQSLWSLLLPWFLARALFKAVYFYIELWVCESVLVTCACPILCTPIDCKPTRLLSVHGILQARILEWVAISSSRGYSWPWIEAMYPSLWADSLPSEPPGKLWSLLFDLSPNAPAKWLEVMEKRRPPCGMWQMGVCFHRASVYSQ